MQVIQRQKCPDGKDGCFDLDGRIKLKRWLNYDGTNSMKINSFNVNMSFNLIPLKIKIEL